MYRKKILKKRLLMADIHQKKKIFLIKIFLEILIENKILTKINIKPNKKFVKNPRLKVFSYMLI